MFIRILLIGLMTPLVWADVELQTSIVDIYYRGPAELLGVPTFTITSDEFSLAGPDNPVFIRLLPQNNARLCKTLVNLGGSGVEASPIYVAMRITQADAGDVTFAAPPETLSIVRWVEGESAIWLQLNQATNTWLSRNGNLISPDADISVSFTIGASAWSSRNQTATRAADTYNLPFNTRNANTPGTIEDAISTLFCVDLSNGTLAAQGTDSLLVLDMIAFDKDVDLGGGSYSSQAGLPLGTSFSGLAYVARGKNRIIDSDIVMGVNATRHEVHEDLASVTNHMSIFLNNFDVNSILKSYLWPGSIVHLEAEGGGLFREDSVRLLSDVSCGQTGTIQGDETTLVVYNGLNYYSRVDLVWNGEVLELNNLLLDLEATIYMVPGTYVETAWYINWELHLASHEANTVDAEVADGFVGDDQHGRCDPYSYTIDTDRWLFASLTYDRFLPHLTKVGGDFSTILRLHNAGTSFQSVQLLLQDQKGALIFITQLTLAANETVDRPVEEILGGEEASHALVTGDPSVKVSAIYKAKRDDASPVHINSTDLEATHWRLFAGDRNLTFDGLAVVNRGSDRTTVVGRHLDANGNLIAEMTLSTALGIGEKDLYVLSTLFEALPGDLFEIITDEPVGLVALRGDHTSTYIWENRAQPVFD